MHHAVFDAGSLAVLRDDLTELLAAATAHRPAALPELAIQYADWAAWQRDQLTGGSKSVGYWLDRLAGLPTVHELPTDRPRPQHASFAGAEHRFELAESVTGRLADTARALSATEAMVLLAGYLALLTRLSGSTDIVVGLPVDGRDRPELAPLIGMFVNPVVIRVDTGGDPSFADLVGRVREAVLGAHEHADVPVQLLVDRLGLDRDPAVRPLYQLSFNHLPHSGLDASYGTARDDLLLELATSTGRIEYRTDLFDAATVTAFADRYQRLLAAGLAAPQQRIGALPLLTDREFAEATARPEPVAHPDGTLDELIGAQVRRTPDATAVAAETGELSYHRLWRRAGALAAELAEAGVGPGTPVAVCADRGPNLLTALLAVLRAGGHYLPVDPGYPADRIRFMLDDAAAPVLLADRARLGQLPATGARIRCLDDPIEPTDAAPDAASHQHPRGGAHRDPGAAAYLIYTSGSTGRPKGVLTSHRAIVNRLCWMQRRFRLGADDAVLQKTPISFDVSVWELFWPLLAGATVVFARPDGHRDPAYLAELVDRAGVTTAHFVPSMLGPFLDALPAGAGRTLRRIVTSGEELPVALARRCVGALPAELHNLYGPTEAAVDVTAWHCAPDALADPDLTTVPLGTPIDNVAVHVLDDRLRPVPPGTIGEICLGGAAPALGYLHRPAATAASFVPDPYGPPGARLYRTGDLGRWRPDGSVLEFRGRRDGQVKIRGQRVELGEVEAALRAAPGVRAAAADLRPDATGEPVLVGWVVGTPPDRAALRATLPDAAVPSVLSTVDRLPVSPSGKLDRSALPTPTGPSGTGEVRYRNTDEEAVAGIWAQVLGVATIGPDDDFFALGGHSLRAAAILARIRAVLGVEVTLGAMFAAPTVAGLARAVAAARAGAGAIAVPHTGEIGELPLSAGQQRLWFLHQLDPADPAYNVPIVRRLHGRLDVEALRRALDTVVARHAPLRTRFLDRDGQGRQHVAPAAPVDWEYVDLRDRPDPAEAAATAVADRLRRPFDLTAGPPLRPSLLTVADDEYLLCLVLHHIVADGWSMTVLLDELAAAYSGRPLPALPHHYGDHVGWQQEVLTGPDAEASLAHWRDSLADPPTLELPTDRPRPPVRGSAGGRVVRDLDPQLTERLAELAAAEQSTMFMLLLAAYQVLLGRHAGQDDVLVGAPIAGRDRIEFEPLIGYFTNTLVLRGDLRGDPAFVDVLRRTRSSTLAAYQHQHVPFETLTAELKLPRDTSRTPVFQAVFTFQNQGTSRAEFAGLTTTSYDEGDHPATCDLTLEAWREAGGGLHTRFTYAAELFDEATIERLAARFEVLLRAVAADPAANLSTVDLLAAGELDRLRDAEQGPALPPYELVPARVARIDPGRTAIRHAGRDVRYAELFEHADRLGARLVDAGVTPGSVVGVHLPPGPDAIAGMLACWRAGAGYLPLDPRYPAARLAYMVADSGVRQVIGAGGGWPGVTSIRPDEAGAGTLPAAGRPDDLAYVCYTSGSTGDPKAVGVPHRALAARVAWMTEHYRITGDDRIVQFASTSFDTHAEELWPGLASGATALVPDGPAAELPDYLRTGDGAGATVLDLPTSYWHELVGTDLVLDWPAGLRLLILGGDQVGTEALAAWRRRVGDRVRVLNTYGPTEATIIATAADLTGAELSHRLPIGRPVGDTRVSVRDGGGRRVPIGVAGELYLGGAGLARGYLGRPAATAAAFVPAPGGGRWYRTGDRVRWRADGQLEFLGRFDEQVKVRGHRVEPGEVEAALASRPGVAQAAVLVHRDPSDQPCLVGYVVGDADAAALRAELATVLPAHLLPAAIVPLDRFPLTANGKLDRAALPAPDAPAAGDATPPDGDAEELVAQVWAETLGRGPLAATDDFFDLGGHSLLATRAVARLSAAVDLPIPIRTLFGHPTVRGFAAELERLLLDDIDESTDAELADEPR
ncbi:non-ribosomal peptide synthetase [Actinocatenispora thailandica]|uniref:non-ribosomal peptide synthetase n=1 Tax=Actinocatenispora thailandica TaxID=227318 RepID=UPI001951B5CB|nr:non-ribosomal peptide synthetase [Actinocatenispora thailandica]